MPTFYVKDKKKRNGFWVLEKTVIGGRFISQSIEEAFVVANFLKKLL